MNRIKMVTSTHIKLGKFMGRWNNMVLDRVNRIGLYIFIIARNRIWNKFLKLYAIEIVEATWGTVSLSKSLQYHLVLKCVPTVYFFQCCMK